MRKHQHLAQELTSILAKEYDENRNIKTPKLKVRRSKSGQESYSSHCGSGILTLHTESNLAEAYALCQTRIAIQAGHLAEYLGENSPQFPLRPIWLKAETEIWISENATLNIPTFLLNDNAESILPKFCRRIIECGYNALLLGSRTYNSLNSHPEKNACDNLEKRFQQLHGYGIKIIVSPNFITPPNCPICPYDDSFCHLTEKASKELFDKLPTIDYFFWTSRLLEATYCHHKIAWQATESEAVLKEIQLLESCVKDHSELIFYVPAPDFLVAKRQASWLSSLIDDMDSKTTLAFSAVAGPFYEDHLKDHPFWKALRESPDASATRLLPILNFGFVKQGEGLWPTANFDLIDRFLSRCRRHHFSGVITLSNELPEEGSLLDCNLWVAGQSLWKNRPYALLAETWFTAFRPDEDFDFCYKAMKICRDIALELSYLRSLAFRKAGLLSIEECRAYAEKHLTSLKLLKCTFENLSKKKKDRQKLRPSVNDYFLYFAADVRIFLERFLQAFNVSAFNILNTAEIQDAFWISSSYPKGQTLEELFLDEPKKGALGSNMEAIFLENRFKIV